jgi:hypothetical protein
MRWWMMSVLLILLILWLYCCLIDATVEEAARATMRGWGYRATAVRCTTERVVQGEKQVQCEVEGEIAETATSWNCLLACPVDQAAVGCRVLSIRAIRTDQE